MKTNDLLQSFFFMKTNTHGGEFQKLYKEIYPTDLVLKLENSGCHATFLDLDIIISNGKISTKLYDKRDSYSFFLLYTCQTFIATFHHLFLRN